MRGDCKLPVMPNDVTTVSYATAQVDAPFHRWVVCSLLFLATTINYMDRQILGILAPLLQKDIGWNEVQYGHIVMAFQTAYGIGVLIFGYLIDRLGTRMGYSAAIFLWSIAACLHAAARSVATFASARFLLGLGEAGNFPSAVKAVAEWFPQRERALATGLFNSGSNVGAVTAPALVPALALGLGWRSAFIIVGSAGFIWVIAWLAFYRVPQVTESLTEPAPRARTFTWPELFLHPQTWANVFQSACVAPIWWFYLYWLPKFFSSTYGLSLSHLGLPLMVVYSMSLVGSILGGLLPAGFLALGHSVNFSRKMSFLICAALTLPVAFVTRLHDVWQATLIIGLAAASMQGWSANSYTMVSDLFPKDAIASIVGIGTASGAIVSIAFSDFAGNVLERSGSYTLLFVLAGSAFPAALVFIHLFAPRWKMAEL
jgi:MFS transporter, ACS family, hexuronate transporter